MVWQGWVGERQVHGQRKTARNSGSTGPDWWRRQQPAASQPATPRTQVDKDDGPDAMLGVGIREAGRKRGVGGAGRRVEGAAVKYQGGQACSSLGRHLIAPWAAWQPCKQQEENRRSCRSKQGRPATHPAAEMRWCGACTRHVCVDRSSRHRLRRPSAPWRHRLRDRPHGPDMRPRSTQNAEIVLQASK